MGGHGGLNILPQKRWNVYNRDNRLKVARDEAAARAQEEEEQARAQQAEREFRHQQLLRRAAGPNAEAEAPAPSFGASQAADQLEHINFWKEDELKLKEQHPEVVAAKLDEVRRRGNKDTYTSDPKFDERFQFGYQLKGDQPWWATMDKKRKDTMDTQTDPLLPQLMRTGAPQASQPAAADALPAPPSGRKRRRLSRGRHESNKSDGSASDDDPQVAAAKAFLLQTLGPEQLQGLQRHSTRHSDSDSSSNSSSNEDSPSNTSSTSTSDSSRGSVSSDDEASSDSCRRSARARRKDQKKSKHRSKKSRDKKGKSRDGDGDGGRSKSREKKSRKSHKSSKSKSKSKDRGKGRKRDGGGASGSGGYGGGSGAAGSGVKSIEQLRQERLAREEAERAKSRLVMVGAMQGDAAGKEPAGYNQAFGFADHLKKRQKRT